MTRHLATFLLVLSAWFPLQAAAEMRGHGGPVKAIAISPDGKTAVTGSFDTTVIIWDLEREIAKQVLRLHEGPVNGVQFRDSSEFLTGSDDGRLILWTTDNYSVKRVIGERGPPIIGFHAGAIEGKSTAVIVSGDRTVALAALESETIVRRMAASLTEQPLALAASGPDIILSLANASLRWMVSGKTLSLPTNANTLAATPDGEIIAGGADGSITILRPDGSIRLTVEVQEMPITSLAVSTDGKLIAAAGLRGAVKIIARDTGKDISTLIGPGLPVWSLAFHPDGQTILTGGADRMVRKWTVATGQPLAPANAPRADFPASVMNERGAQVFRACDACHTVTPDGGNRAGPTLHGVFGRRIGTAKDYVYSQDFGKHAITWNAETIARLFREGPLKVTPGTKMPDQTIGDAEDLKALVEWLERVTR
ncbi:MAG: c-type cytochrome [Beijerinckiaceae bacterium]